MIYFFHHYELPVILQQAQIQDILMRNQQDGGPPLRLTQRSFINNNSENNNNNNGGGQQQQPQNNGGQPQPPREVARAAGFNFAGFRFRFGVVLTTHQSHRHVRVSHIHGKLMLESNYQLFMELIFTLVFKL